ncbi:Protein halfway, partial [Blattella germanica]
LQPSYNLTRFHFRNATLSELDLDLFYLPHLESIAITDGKVDRVVRKNFTFPNLKCLNLSNNLINELDSHLVENVPNLEQLDLSFNNLTNLSISTPGNNNNNNTDFYIDISNNSQLWCNSISDLKTNMHNASYNLNFVNQHVTTCKTTPRGYWFKFSIIIQFQQLESIEKVNAVNEIKFIGISVNCVGKNLTSLPDVPQYTTVLNISNNNVKLHAQRNQIPTLQDIEGSAFLRQFQMLDIRDNKLNEIQTYIFNHAFEQHKLRQVLMAGNKIKCDCNTAQHIMSLDTNQVCKFPRVWTDYINYIIAGEVILLFLIVSKVSYDYWIFRTAGYLPWPASKMPKMPCDWIQQHQENASELSAHCQKNIEKSQTDLRDGSLKKC